MSVPEDRPAVVTVPALLTLQTVAELLGCRPRTVRRRIDIGELRAVTEHGRTMVRGDDLRAYVDALEAVGATPPRAADRPGGAMGSCRARRRAPIQCVYLIDRPRGAVTPGAMTHER